jgi:hypothetical protein
MFHIVPASERRVNKSEYASVMVLLRRITEFTATQNKYMRSSACLRYGTDGGIGGWVGVCVGGLATMTLLDFQWT